MSDGHGHDDHGDTAHAEQVYDSHAAHDARGGSSPSLVLYLEGIEGVGGRTQDLRLKRPMLYH